MADPIPQLGQMPYANIGGYIPRQPKTPHLWQEALVSFLGNAANQFGTNEIKSLMAPTTVTGTDTTANGKSFQDTEFGPNKHWWQTTPTAQDRAALTNANVNNLKLATEATHEGKITDPTVAAINAGAGKTKAETGQIGALTPAMVAHMGAESGLLNQQGQHIAAMTPYEQGEAGSRIALQGAQAGEAGQRGDYYDQLSKWMGPETAAKISNMGANTGLTQAQVSHLGAQTNLEQRNAFSGLAPQALAMSGLKPGTPEHMAAQRAISMVPLDPSGDVLSYQNSIQKAILDARMNPSKYLNPQGPQPDAFTPHQNYNTPYIP